MQSPVEWGIISTGKIAGAFAAAVSESPSGRLAAVASRNEASAQDFARRFSIPRSYGSYESLLEDAAVQAVYVATPHPMHAVWTIRAAQAGKHVLCEKPLAMNSMEAAEMIDAARRCDVFLMEAFMYRCHPQTARIVKLLREGAIGRVRSIQAAFSYQGSQDPRQRIRDKSLGGGGILDVGCYPLSMCRLLAGASQGRPFAEPEELFATAALGEFGSDEAACAVARFDGGILAQMSAGIAVLQENALRVYGTRCRRSSRRALFRTSAARRECDIISAAGAPSSSAP